MLRVRDASFGWRKAELARRPIFLSIESFEPGVEVKRTCIWCFARCRPEADTYTSVRPMLDSGALWLTCTQPDPAEAGSDLFASHMSNAILLSDPKERRGFLSDRLGTVIQRLTGGFCRMSQQRRAG